MIQSIWGFFKEGPSKKLLIKQSISRCKLIAMPWLKTVEEPIAENTKVKRSYFRKPGLRLEGRQKIKISNWYLLHSCDFSWSTLKTCRLKVGKQKWMDIGFSNLQILLEISHKILWNPCTPLPKELVILPHASMGSSLSHKWGHCECL